MFSAGEQWNSINWPLYAFFSLLYYVAPFAGLGFAVAAVVAAVDTS